MSQKSAGDRVGPDRIFKPKMLLFGLILVILTGLALSGVPAVPFHPDESTQLYMSSDFELLFSDPLAMSWNPDRESDLRQRYRELDAPLTKYILGLGRKVAGFSALPTDWDWSASWLENRQTGALPEPGLLLAGRYAVTLLVPLSLIIIFLIGKEMGGFTAGLVAMLILGSSALVLLHGRRAMAEGALLFGVSLAIWGFIKGQRLPWLAGLGMALAFNAKQSTLPLLPVGLLAVSWLTEPVSSRAKKVISNLVQFGLMFAVLSFLLNPLLWSNPLGGLQASWSARSDLLARQVDVAYALAPEQVMPDASQRAAVIIANLWIQPPAFYEVGNYRQQTAAAEAEYLKNPLNSLFRGIGWGAIFLSLAILGIVLSGLAIFKPIRFQRENIIDPNKQRRMIAIVLLAGIFQLGGLLAAVPLPFQRYVVPLIPFVCIWSGFGVQQSIKIVGQRKSQ